MIFYLARIRVRCERNGNNKKHVFFVWIIANFTLHISHSHGILSIWCCLGGPPHTRRVSIAYKTRIACSESEWIIEFCLPNIEFGIDGPPIAGTHPKMKIFNARNVPDRNRTNQFKCNELQKHEVATTTTTTKTGYLVRTKIDDNNKCQCSVCGDYCVWWAIGMKVSPLRSPLFEFEEIWLTCVCTHWHLCVEWLFSNISLSLGWKSYDYLHLLETASNQQQQQ